jgi:hypothetical protein
LQNGGFFFGEVNYYMRPKPTDLLWRTDGPRTIIVAEAHQHAVYAVTYRGKPISLRYVEDISGQPRTKYPRTSFANPGHAHNMAAKLAKRFGEVFEVVRLQAGEVVIEKP